MITMKNWRESMSEDMRLRDLRQRTLEAYLLAIRLFLQCIGKPPEALTEADIRGYMLHLRDEKRQTPSSINIAICALRNFFNFTLQRDYEVFALLRVNRLRSLPVVLSRAKVKRLLGATVSSAMALGTPRHKPRFPRCPMTMNRRTQNQLPHRTRCNGQRYHQERLQAPMHPLPAHTSTLGPAFEASRPSAISLTPAPNQLPQR